MRNFLSRIKNAYLVLVNRGVLISINDGDKMAVLKLHRIPNEGDTISIGNLTATFSKKL